MKEAYKETLRLMLVLTLVSLFACGGIGSDAPEYFCDPNQIYYTYPEDNETDVVGYRKIFVRFTDLMDDSTINESTFTLEDDTGNIVDGSIYFYDRMNCVLFCTPEAHAYFYPSRNLDPSTRYTATLDSTGQDEDGNSLKCNYTWSITTKADDGIGFWEPVSTIGAPSEGTAVWTGNEMIVWGGYHFSLYFDTEYFDTGGRYDPLSDSWQETSTIGAPEGRDGHTAVWTGGEIIVWNGTGGRYIP